MRLRKIISVFLLLSLLMLTLASCKKTPEGLIGKADKKLAKQEHKIEISIDYTVNNLEIAGIFDQLGATEITVLVDGDRAAVDNRLVIDVDGEKTEFKTVCTIIGSEAYMNMSYSIGSYENSTKGRAQLYEGDREKLLDKATVIGAIDSTDFEQSSLSRDEDEYIIVCTGRREGLDEKLGNILESELEGAAKSILVKDARLEILVEDGRYESVELFCEYEIELGEKTYTVRAEYELEYNYDERIDVSRPSDSPEYRDMAVDVMLSML